MSSASPFSLPPWIGRRLGAIALLTLVGLVVLVPALSIGGQAPAPAPVASASPTVDRPAVLPASSIYREALVGVPASLNPLFGTGESELAVAGLLFAGLARGDGHGGVEPDLAASWTVAETGRVYTVALRADAVWHDGQPVTSRDVLFTVRLLQESGLPINPALASFWRTVRVDVAGPQTVRFTVSEPYAPFLSRLTFPLLPAHRLHSVHPGDLPAHDFSRAPVGTGPYRIATPLRDGDLLLAAHSRYHRGPPAVERVLLRFYMQPDEALQALLDGAVDGMAGVPIDLLPRARALAGLRTHAQPLAATTALLLNLRRPPFHQREVRQALAMAIDRTAIIQEALAGEADPVTGPIAPTSWAAVAPPAGGSIHEARALLERAGWLPAADGGRARDGRPLTISLLTTDSPERSRAALVIARQLREIGLHVTIVTVSPADLVTRHLAPRDFEAALFGWSALGEDPDPYPMWHSSQSEVGYNFAGWSVQRADELLEAGRQQRDPATRARLYAEFQRLFADDTPSVVLYSPRYYQVTTERVHLVAPGPLTHPADRFRSITGWTVDPERAVG
jgi:peptide/nickel transport system substrate-binding protein